PLNSKNRAELDIVWREWFSKIEKKAPYGLKMEHLGIIDMLKKYDYLNLKGGLLRVDEEIVAFSIGEALSEECVVIHIEKANTSYHGAYQAINQQFLSHEWSGFKYVNREEDLGIEGLRKAKLSYHPVILGKKYEVVLS
ncbi:MAG: phosphatidylglycerol lysyltransferase domain-containing protein, partial [Campylobacterales bacterium]